MLGGLLLLTVLGMTESLVIDGIQRPVYLELPERSIRVDGSLRLTLCVWRRRTRLGLGRCRVNRRFFQERTCCNIYWLAEILFVWSALFRAWRECDGEWHTS